MSELGQQIYVNDHLALMTSELELLRRTKESNSDSPLGEALGIWETEVEQQFRRLEVFLESNGGGANTLKQAAAWLTEKVGRLKPNDGGSEYTDLARVIELETLTGLAFARETMWRVLRNIPLDASQIPSEFCGNMEAQASEQVQGLQEFHQHAVADALGIASTIHDKA